MRRCRSESGAILTICTCITEYFSFFNFAEEQELATLKQGLRLDQDEIGDSFDTCYALYDTFCLSLLEAVVDLAYEHFFIYWVGARCEVVPSPAGNRFLPFPLAYAVSVQSARKASTPCSAKAPRRVIPVATLEWLAKGCSADHDTLHTLPGAAEGLGDLPGATYPRLNS